MRAVVVTGTGGPEVLELQDWAAPAAGAGEIVVDVSHAGVNYRDVYERAGPPYGGEPPFVAGVEGAGKVAAVGEGVTGFAPGDRVAWSSAQGSYAEQVAVGAGRAVAVPADVSDELAAAAILQGMTAQYLCNTTYPVQPGDPVVVHAAAGGVGLLLCQMAKMRGARVIGTVSTEEKAKLAREAGADEVILYTKQDFEAEVKRITGGKGLQVVYDSVGKTTFEKGFGVLAPRGMMVLYGQSSGTVAPLDVGILAAKGSLFLTRPSLFAYTATREELVQRAGDVLGWIRDGRLRLRMEFEFPLTDVAEAHRALEGRKTTGKVLLIP
jgi:NADPH2:quinone reductase